MALENRVPDETVNYSDEHPLKEFIWLIVGVTASVAIAIALIGFFAGELAARLPFSVERGLVDSAPGTRAEQATARLSAAEKALEALAARLAARMDLEPGMSVDIRLVDSKMVNAFASIGGQVMVHRGLIAKMPDENTLAMVLAHEIAHVKRRHPVRGAGRGVAIGLLLVAVGFGSGGAAADLATGTGTLTLLSFSRGQEQEADQDALAALNALYGHVGGSRELFALLASEGGRPDGTRVAMLQTHPLTGDRVANLADHASRMGWKPDGARTPLPPELAVFATP